MKQFLKYTLASLVGVFLASVLVFLVFIGIVSSISKSDSDFAVRDNSILKIALSGTIQEQSIENPFNINIPGLPMDTKDMTQGLDDILGSIEKASKNDKIKGIYLEVGTIATGWSTANEIREALLKFKKTGKFVYAYGGMIDQKEYFMCSAADSIFINPEGMIQLGGLSANPVFYKKTLDKLGVKAEIFKVGTFKSAVEPYILTKMSDASRLQTKTYMSDIWATILAKIGTSRKLSVAQLNKLADDNTIFRPAEDLVNDKLADSLTYETGFIQFLKNKLSVKDADKISFISPSNLMKSLETQTSVAIEKVAIIYADGEIYDSGTEGIVSKKLIEDIETVRKDSLVKAVVLRVNSPGGSAYASEQIWKALQELKARKPFVVSMGDYAASGGYYISCGANKILASPNTLTGSIGIFGMFFVMDELADKIGLSFDVVKTNTNADLGNTTRPMTDFEKLKIQAHVNRGYELFVKRCSEGRKMDVNKLKSIAEGRVWTGQQAKEIGLVDGLGTLKDAVALASKLGKVSDFRLVSYPEKKNIMDELLNDLSGDATAKIARVVLGAEYEPLLKLKASKIQTGILAKMEPLDIH